MENLKQLEIPEQEIGRELGDQGFRSLASDLNSVTLHNQHDKKRFENAEIHDRIRASKEEQKVKPFAIGIVFQFILLFFVGWFWKILLLGAIGWCGWQIFEIHQRAFNLRNRPNSRRNRSYPRRLTKTLADFFGDLLTAIDAHNKLTDRLVAAQKLADLGHSEGLRRRDEIVSKMQEKREQFIKGLRTFRVYLDHPESISSTTNIHSILDHSVDDFGEEVRKYVEDLNADVLGAIRVDNDSHSSEEKRNRSQKKSNNGTASEPGRTYYSEDSSNSGNKTSDFDFEDLA